MFEIMNMHEWRRNAIASRKPMVIPVMTHPGIEALGCTVRELITDGQTHAKAVRYLADRYPMGAACMAMDLTVEAEAFGADVVFPEHEIASVTGRMLKDREDIFALKVPKLDSGRIREFLLADVTVARCINDRPVLAGCIGPFSLAGRLYGMSEIMLLMYNDAEATHQLLRKCTDFLEKYCKAQKATGVDGVLMAEPAAGLMSDEDCMRFSSQYVKQIVDAVQDERFVLILHNCGNTGHCTKAMVATGADAYHFGNKCVMAEVMKEVPADKLGMGNLDPVAVLKEGTVDRVKQEVEALAESCKDYPNFVLSTGCDTPPLTPIENIEAMLGIL